MMTVIPGYNVLETIFRDEELVVSRGERNHDNLPVLLKSTVAKRPHIRVVERLEHEYSFRDNLNSDWAICPLELLSYSDGKALVLQFSNGLPLDQALLFPISISRFLDVAIALAAALAAMHQADIVHRDINPHNILLDPNSGRVQFTGFGIASQSGDYRPAHSSGIIEGLLPYISPEQTGRMNRIIDYRSDLYSLGVTFYQMSVGQLPFKAQDALEWIYAHIAVTPIPPSEALPGIPGVVSDIIMKLMSKIPEERYQSALGLKADLERCRAEFASTGEFVTFALAQHDIPERLQIPQKLYGREREVRDLIASFERVLSDGKPELLLVSGYSGTGKSSLVRELYKPALQASGFFVSGKFDQYQRNIPYSTIIQAFQELIQQILASSEVEIEHWKSRLLAAIGINAQLIIDVIPQLGLIIGEQPNVVDLPPAEAQNRFNHVFQQFMCVFASREHPLVVFLDDLQWADEASLRLMSYVMLHPDTQYLLFAGAYRTNEVDTTHPLARRLTEIRDQNAHVEQILLTELSAQALDQFIADTFVTSRVRVEPLAGLIYEKTGGNPFFVIQMLRRLYEQALVWFDVNVLAWNWDIGKIEAVGFSDNIADLMVARLKGLSPVATNLLKLASAIGNQIDIDTLSIVNEKSVEKTEEELQESIKDGFVLRSGQMYKFAHDRIQQAAYSLIPEIDRGKTHLHIGQLLLKNTTEPAIEDKAFDIANQLNQGLSLIHNREDRITTAQVNLLAGKKARSSGAFCSAAAYLSAGVELLPDDAWENNYGLAFSLYLELAGCEVMTGEFDEAESLFPTILAHAQSRIDKANAYQIKVYLHVTKGENDKGVATGIECLKLFDINLTAHPTREQMLAGHEAVWTNLGERTIESLIDSPWMDDPELVAAMEVLTDMMPAAYFSDENLRYLTASTLVNLSLIHGSTECSVMGYEAFANTLGPVFRQYKEGYQFGKLAIDFVDKFGIVRFKGRVYYDVANQVYVWNMPIREAVEYLYTAMDVLEQVGDINYGCYCANNLVTLRRVKGDPLADVYQESERQLAYARRVKYIETVDIISGMQRLIRNLQGHTSDYSTFSEGDFNEDEFEAYLVANRMPIVVCWHHIFTLEARFIFGYYDKALKAAEKAAQLIWTTRTAVHHAQFHYFRSLTLAAVFDQATEDQKKDYLELLRASHSQFEEWADNSPENWRHGYLLISAEMARLSGGTMEAMKLYDQSIACARENGLVQYEAIGNELAAKFYLKAGFETIAKTYLREARYCYERWGADGKVKQLDELYPRLLETMMLGTLTDSGVREAQLDVLTVARASQAISGEIDLSRLLDTLMKIVVEQAGAEKGYLLLSHEEKGFLIDVEAVQQAGQIKVTLYDQPASASRLPDYMLNYVMRTKAMVLLDDATSANPFVDDSYVERNKPKSVLCLPIVRQTELLGMLYLENSLITGAFTQDRIAVLELLASQAAISLQNAIEYAKRRLAEQKRLEAEEHKQEFYRRTILAATGGKLIVSEQDEIKNLACSELASWEIKQEADLSYIRRDTVAFAKSAGMDDNRAYDFVLAVGEATTNAIKHAGGGSGTLCRRDDSLVFVVSDEGSGIETLVLPEVALLGGYSTKGTLGMGYKTILTVADKVYLSTGSAGTTVAIEMKVVAPEMPAFVDNLPEVYWES